MILKSAFLAAVHTDGLSFVASFGTGGNSILTINIAVFDSWVVGAKGAKSTLAGAIIFGWAFRAKIIFASCTSTFKALVSEKDLNGICENKLAFIIEI